MLDETNKICGCDTGLWCFIIEKHGTAYKKCKNIQPVMDVINVYDCLQVMEDKSYDDIYDTLHVDVD